MKEKVEHTKEKMDEKVKTEVIKTKLEDVVRKLDLMSETIEGK